MFAPTHHAAMRHVGPVRAELGTRTIFNLLGPAVQSGRRQAPAPRRLLAGAGSSRWPRRCSNLGLGARLGGARLDGLDEITTTGPTQVSATRETARSATSRSRRRMSGCSAPSPTTLKGGDAADQRRGARAACSAGEQIAYRDIARAQRRRGAGDRRQGGGPCRRRAARPRRRSTSGASAADRCAKLDRAPRTRHEP